MIARVLVVVAVVVAAIAAFLLWFTNGNTDTAVSLDRKSVV